MYFVDCVSFLLFYQLTCEYSRLCEERPLYSHFFCSFQTRRWSDAAKNSIQACTCFPNYLHMILVGDGKFKFVCHEWHWRGKHVGE